jgi:hypothetical protein
MVSQVFEYFERVRSSSERKHCSMDLEVAFLVLEIDGFTASFILGGGNASNGWLNPGRF